MFKDRSRLTNRAGKFWEREVFENLYHWNKYTLKGKRYYDALFTRFYMDLEDKIDFPQKSLQLIKMLWDNEDVLIVEGTGTRLGYNNDLFDNVKSIKRILCPAENAFSSYNEILETTMDNANGRLILIALGMTATVLSYDLAMNGFRAIDIGHVDLEYEWYKIKAEKKQPILYRYSNELNCREVDQINDKTYLEQIIQTI